MIIDNFDGFKKSNFDLDIDKKLSDHIEKYNLSHLEIIKLFPVLARRQWLKRLFAHLELFKKTIDIPGDIAELGVFRGLGLFSWANFLETYCIGDRTKVVYGFDNWKGFSKLDREDGFPVLEAQKIVGGFNPEKYYEELIDAISIFDADRFVSWKDRIKLINGDIEETIPKFISENPGIRFSLVHFDCDLYAPTKIALECLWSKISRGGILIFDEYSIKDWPGETLAVDEFLTNHPELKLKTFNWTNTPGAYLIKT